MSTYNTLLSIFSIGVMLDCGLLMNDKSDLTKKIDELDLTIVKLEGKVVDQESEIRILTNDIDAKKLVIASLEERVQVASASSQEVIDRLIELSGISSTPIHPASGPIEVPPEPINNRENIENRSALGETPADVKDEHKRTEEKVVNKRKLEVVDEDASKKFINLRNNIYSRFR